MVLMYRTAAVIPSVPLAPPALPAPLPLVFGPTDRRLFGWYHPARPGLGRGTAVVLCYPLGNEALRTHSSYRYLAEQLAEAGYPVLRFDYDGTGDSFGSDEDDNRVESWQASIGFAIDTLRDRSGVFDIALFGVRLGATLAAVTASERGDVSRLLLWAPCRTGRSYLREMRVLRAAGSQASGALPSGSDGEYEEAAGFIFTSATVAALNGLDMAALRRKPATEALLIGRDDLPGDERLAERLAALGTAVTQVPWPGYAAMMRDPQDTEIPQAAIASLVDWLHARAASAPASPTATVPEMASDGFALTDDAFTEEPMLLETSPLSFGVLTRPRTNNGRGRTVALLLNVGANHHIGPNRMSVALARHLAAQGFPALRLDIPGVGDSARDAVSARPQIYADAAIQHIQEAMNHLEAHLGAERFVLIGLCSGAYMAYQVAATDPRVSTQILINPQTFEWKEGDSLEVRMSQSYKSTGVYLTSVRDAALWKRLLRGQVDVKGIAAVLCSRLTARCGVALKSTLSLALKLKPFETPVRQTFRRIAERGTDTFFLFAAEDIGIEMTALHFGTKPRHICGQKNFCLAVIEDADHIFTQKAARKKMLSRIVEHLTGRYPE